MKTISSIFTCLGSPHHLEDLKQLQPVWWTISKKAKKGDWAVFYLTAPISAIVGFGQIVKTPWYENESEWKEKHFTEISRLVMLDEDRFIRNSELRILFPEWRYILQPRSSVAAPEAVIAPLWELLNERK